MPYISSATQALKRQSVKQNSKMKGTTPAFQSRWLGFVALSCLLLVTTGLLASDALAQTASDTAESSRLARLETQIFSGEYHTDSMEDRLKRLEKSVFGTTQSGETSGRLKKLEKTLRPYEADEPEVNNSPVQAAQSVNNREESAPEQPDGTDYPTVTAIERIVFARDFIRDALTNRLSRLEQKVYGRVYNDLALVDRVDNLLERYPQASLGIGKDDDYPASSRPAGGPGSYSFSSRPAGGPQVPVSEEDFYARKPDRDLMNADIYTKLEVLERNILGPNARQSGKLLTDRLDTLERQVFGYSQMGTLSGRLDKLLQTRSEAITLMKHQEMNHQEQQQSQASNPIYPAPNYQAASPPPSPHNPNIQIGMGVSSNSQYQFSPEVLNLLPNDVRMRVMNPNTVGEGYNANSSSTGAVTMTETVTQPGGFYQLPNGLNVYTPPQQYQNAYQLTPLTLPAPTGQDNQQDPTYAQPVQAGQPLPPPPTLLSANGNEVQALSEMENTVFGRINASDPIELRLWRLESHMSGQTYGGYPLQERIANLQKIYQYQYLGTILQHGQNQSPKAVPNTWEHNPPGQ
ncbi:MAG: hypothetical protein VKJ04_03895 [Vampirovibrionales bacterium]|nr:hypothetical protein [Vampirovibrionales bacterium]